MKRATMKNTTIIKDDCKSLWKISFNIFIRVVALLTCSFLYSGCPEKSPPVTYQQNINKSLAPYAHEKVTNRKNKILKTLTHSCF